MSAASQELVLGPLVMDRALMARFAAFSGDHSPLHMDPLHGARSMYGSNVVHGMLPIMFVPLALNRLLAGERVRITHINGQFLRPLMPGTPIHISCHEEDSTGTERTFSYAVRSQPGGAPITRGNLRCVPFNGEERGSPRVTPGSLMIEDLAIASHRMDELHKDQRSSFDVQWGPAQEAAYLELVRSCVPDPSLVKESSEMALLATFSTVVGMCMPGSTATFQSFSADLHEHRPAIGRMNVSAVVTAVSQAAHTIAQDVVVGTADPVHITGRVAVQVDRPDFIPPSMQEIEQRIRDTGLRGRVALITGGARGIGATTAKLLALHGAKVVVNYRGSRTEAEALVAEIRAAGGDAFAVQADVSRPEDVQALVAAAVERYGTVHILVNGAAADFRPIPFLETSWDQVQRDIDVIVKGAFLCAQAVVPYMIAQRSGKIVNLSTVATEVPPRDQFKYVVAKSALTGITRSLAVELAEHDIQVNQVVPSMVETDLTRGVNPVALGKMRSMAPMRRLASAIEVAEAIVHLASSRSNYTTGQKLFVTGGLPPFA